MSSDKVQFAVNLADWAAHRDDIGLMLLLRPVVDPGGQVLDCEPGRFDGMAVRLDCPQERAEAIVEVVRVRYERHRLRLYRRGNGRTWRRV